MFTAEELMLLREIVTFYVNSDVETRPFSPVLLSLIRKLGVVDIEEFPELRMFPNIG